MSVSKIAKMAGVSVATVSRVLNNLPSVKEENRKKVFEAIEKCNYTPNLLARQLRTSRAGMLLVMVSNISNPFCARVVGGIEEIAEANGYRILLCNTYSDLARAKSALNLLTGKVVDGVITMDALSSLSNLKEDIKDAPWVQCAEYDPSSNIPSVSVDDIAATKFAINKLIKEGRCKIALLNHDLSYKYAQDRQKAYLECLAEHKLEFKKIVYANELSVRAGIKACEELLEAQDEIDAIFAVSDLLAAGAIKAVTRRKISIPNKLSIIGFDGDELGELASPSLSTIVQPAHEMGKKACEILLNKINKKDDSKEEIIHHKLQFTYLKRESTIN